MSLDLCRPRLNHSSHQHMTVSTPLALDAWSQSLAPHPDRAFANYICEGIQCGFRIGFQRGSPLKSATSNMESARQHPDIVSEYLRNEIALGRMLGPFATNEDLPPLQVNQFGVIPKGHNSGKWRLITDLSHPLGHSVNDGVDPALCSMAYTTVDDVAAVVTQLGTGANLAKVDIESAYRLIPVHPQDRPLQAMQWEDKLFIDPMLPFGLLASLFWGLKLTRWQMNSACRMISSAACNRFYRSGAHINHTPAI